MGKAIRKVRKLGAKLDFTHQLLKSAGLPSPGGDIAHGEFKALSPEEKAAKKEMEALESAGSAAAPAAAPTAVSDDTLAAREAMRRRQLAAAGMGGTTLTGSRGLTGASTAGKSLLGS